MADAPHLTDSQREQVAAIEPLVRGLVRRWYGGRVSMWCVEEMEQEAVAAICAGIGHYNPRRARLVTWATRTTLGACLHWFRDKLHLIRQARGKESVKCVPIDDELDAAEEVDTDALLRVVLGERLLELSMRQQAVYSLVCLRGYTQVEASEALGVHPWTVSRDVRVIREALRGCL